MDTNSIALGILIALISCLTNVSSQQRKCLFSSNYCPGQFRDMKAICKDGYCFCTGQDYDYITCLPDAYGCRIEVDSDAALAKPLYNNQQPSKVYSCTPGSSSTQYEVHVLSVHEVINTRPPSAGDNVNIVSSGKSGKPVILVLASYKPVNWSLNLPAGVTISKVILVAHYIDESSVSGDVNQVQVVQKQGTRNSQWSGGFGEDSGGGDTVGLLRQVHSRFGVVTSFTGTYKADKWTLTLSSQVDVYGCRIEVDTDAALAKPLYNNQQPSKIYSCTPGSSSTQYEVHVLSVYEGNRHTRPPSAGDTNVTIVSSGWSGKPIILVVASYEPVNWILNLPAGVTINNVILVAYYIDESSVSGDVNQVQVVQKQGTRNSQWRRGFGEDSGGGDTVGLLRQVHSRFGVVTSFTGTYKADKWTLTLSSQAAGGDGDENSQETIVSWNTTQTAGAVNVNAFAGFVVSFTLIALF